MADALPGKLVLPTRDALRDAYLRSYRVRNAAADTGPDGQPYVDASNFADQMMPAYFDAQVISNGTSDETSTGSWLEARGAALGAPRLPEAGGSGFITIVASTGGGTIFDGDVARDPKSGLRFKCTATALYTNGQYVPITGLDTGVATNLKAGTVIEWTAPRPGIGQFATVVLQSDGSGLSGGRLKESDEEYRLRLQNLRANPPASGNDAEYQKTIEGITSIAIQKAFTYPCIFGPGTAAFVFTLRPGTPGASRIPNAAQVAQVLATLVDKFPGDDGIFAAVISAQLIDFAYKATWQKTAAGWADATPWPSFIAGDMVRIDNTASISATAFTLKTGTSTTDPQVGQTIAFWDKSTGTFRRKRILTVTIVTSNKKWTLTVDTANGASDPNYVPNAYSAGQVASPWADSLDLVSPAVTGYIGSTIGPGEMFSSFADPGIRQRRQPESPDAWTSVISNRALRPVQDLAAVFDAELVAPTVPFATTVGTPGTAVNLIEPRDLAVFKQ